MTLTLLTESGRSLTLGAPPANAPACFRCGEPANVQGTGRAACSPCVELLIQRGKPLSGRPTSSQAADALAAANARRSGAAELSREVRAGDLAGADAIADPRAACMPAERLLLVVPRVGADEARRMLGAAGVHGIRRVRDLTARQVQVLAEHPRMRPVALVLIENPTHEDNA